MKTLRLVLALAAFLTVSLPSQANIFFYPDKDEAWFSLEIPEKWQPKMEDETLEANSPDDEANLVFWVLDDRSSLENLEKDIEDILQDSVMKVRIKKKTVRKGANGIEYVLFEGAGKDTEDNSPVGFEAWLFAPHPGKVGIFYCQYDPEAPAKTVRTLTGIVESVKLIK